MNGIDPATVNHVLKGIRKGKTIGTLGGAVFGGLLGGLPKEDIDLNGNKYTRTARERISHGLINSVVWGATGRQIGGLVGGVHNARRWVNNPSVGNGSYRSQFSGINQQPAKPDWLRNAKNKSEAKAAWRSKARQLHPDFGGSARDFHTAEQEWRTHEPFFKEAMLLAFASELEKIAFIGSTLGGFAGYHMAPNTAKGKLVGTLVGAGAGHLVEGAGRLAKKKLVDEPHMREEQALYGYQPYAQASQYNNFY